MIHLFYYKNSLNKYILSKNSVMFIIIQGNQKFYYLLFIVLIANLKLYNINIKYHKNLNFQT